MNSADPGPTPVRPILDLGTMLPPISGGADDTNGGGQLPTAEQILAILLHQRQTPARRRVYY